ncbi:M42 family metallopeptidase [Brevibacillus daliensis]|uniref:M42 family metallopeptidase n=1 Tax=Brevibacillus daliensis TaxID=2892995 RepID=UPI0035A17E3B
MDQQTEQMLRELTECSGVPGFEQEVRQVMKKYIEPYADEISYDNLGSIIAKKTGDENGPKILIAGHLDEVGFMVSRITDDGFLKFQPLGGWWSQVMLAQRVRVQTKDGYLDGVIGSVPPHVMPVEQRRKVVEIKDMFVDIGASSKKEAEEFGARPGDAIIPVCPFTVMKNPKMLMAKAWDNRLGCAAAIDLMKGLQGVEHPNVLYAAGTVMEEVGTRGAYTVANTVKPDIGIAVDVGIAGDTPGINKNDAPSKAGKGVEIAMYDARLIAPQKLRQFVIETAEAEGIPYQLTTIPGGATDAAAFSLTGSGIPSIALSVATRYIHSHASIIHYDDYQNMVKLLVALVKRLDAKQVAELTSFE